MRMAIIKKTHSKKPCQGLGGREPWYTSGGNASY